MTSSIISHYIILVMSTSAIAATNKHLSAISGDVVGIPLFAELNRENFPSDQSSKISGYTVHTYIHRYNKYFIPLRILQSFWLMPSLVSHVKRSSFASSDEL